MRVFSGIQPTGTPHLGNYFGAFVNWVKLQNDGNECFFCVVNQHAITMPHNGAQLAKQTLELGATIIATGIDPEKSVLFVQSDVPAHAEFTWILNCLTPMGIMERMIQFKEKSEKDPSAATVGLFDYPILQAADILLYKADLVPVGIDQAQHLELSRELARKFNNQYKPIFVEPKTFHTTTTKVVGLDGKAKMSKSYNNYIGITESRESIWQKLAPAVTDPARIKKTDAGNPDICNIYSLHSLCSSQEIKNWAEKGCRTAAIGCIECKKQLFESVEKIVAPIRERYMELMDKPKQVREILHEGGKKANKVAQKTLSEVYNLVGFKY